MKVLITGVAGFLGTHVAEFFGNKGWEVVGIDNLTDYELKRSTFDVLESRKHNLDFLEELGIEFHKWDTRTVCSQDFHGVDFIIHCAAQPAMTLAIEDPVNDADNNIFGLINMLEIAKKHKIPFVNCSSIHVYGNNSNDMLTEGDLRFIRKDKDEIDENEPILQGELTPLHVSKRTTELYTKCYGETYGMRTASFRLTGMYGERQFGGMDHGWVANFAIRTVKEREITIFGTSKQVRDILYAKDAANAFYLWFIHGSSGIFNIGGGIENSISLGECLAELSDQAMLLQEITIKPKRQGDLHYFVCDYKKAERDFLWKPKVSPKQGISNLINWINENEGIL